MSAEPSLAIMTEQLLAPVPGGAGRYTRELAGALAAAGEGTVAGWCAWHADVTAAVVAGVNGPRRLPLGRRALALAWERGAGPCPRADVVICPTVLAPPRRRPLVVTIYDAVPGAARRGPREADAVLVPTAAVRDALSAVLPLDLDRVHVLGGAVAGSVATVPPDLVARAERLGLPPRGYLLMVGSLEPRKGLDVAIAALALLAARDPAERLVVAGPQGWGGVDPVALAAQAGLAADRLVLLGRITDEDLAATLAGAGALLALSRNEGFGLPVLEAMAHGVPVVISDAPALVEVAGGAALVTPVGDADAVAAAVTRLRTEARLRQDRAVAGRRRAAEFSWTSAATQLWQIARSLAGKSYD
jgi:glycosyltransferase involved in cell wall biosynthesis